MRLKERYIRVKKMLLLSLTLLVSIVCNAQSLPKPLPVLPKNWQRIYIKDIGSFDLPPTMEIQKGKYKEFTDRYKKIQGFEVSQLTAQQKGLNDLRNSSLEKYGRIMIKTTFGNKDDYCKLDFNTNAITQTDINKLNSIYKKEVQQEFNKAGLNLNEWYSLTTEKVNGMSCLHYGYKRQLQNNPIVIVHVYLFHNNDRMYTLTLSYRTTETEYWKSDFEKILKSFRITNIK